MMEEQRENAQEVPMTTARSFWNFGVLVSPTSVVCRSSSFGATGIDMVMARAFVGLEWGSFGGNRRQEAPMDVSWVGIFLGCVLSVVVGE